MITKQIIVAGCAVMVLSIGAASAGPCNTGDKDAGSGPTPAPPSIVPKRCEVVRVSGMALHDSIWPMGAGPLGSHRWVCRPMHKLSKITERWQIPWTTCRPESSATKRDFIEIISIGWN